MKPDMNAPLAKKPSAWGRRFVIGVPFVWLLIFFLAPFLIVLRISVTQIDETGNPFTSLLTLVDGVMTLKLKFANYVMLLGDDLYFRTYLGSMKYALLTTIVSLTIGYPFAYFMSRAKPSRRAALLMMVMLPFWTSFLLRVYAWRGILSQNGLLNHFLLNLGVIDTPLHLLNTPTAVVLGMVYTYLPFMILPLYTNLVKLDGRYLEAAADLGATPWQAFWRITVPLSKSGIIAGAMLVFIPCVGEFVIPEMLGGPETLMIGRVLWDEFFTNNDWSMASSVTVTLVLLILVPMAIFNRQQAQQQAGQK